MGLVASLWELLGRVASDRCSRWTPSGIRAAHLADLMTFGAYMAFVGLGILQLRRLGWGVRWGSGFAAAAITALAFVFACGAGHGVDVWTHYSGDTALLTSSKVLTAAVSWIAVIFACSVVRSHAVPSAVGLARSARAAAWSSSAVVVALACQLGAATLAYRTVKEAEDMAGMRAVAYEEMVHASNRAELLCDAETGQRGYLLTGDREYLVPYLEAARVLSRDPGITPAMREKLGELAETVELNDRGLRDEALEVVREGRGMRGMGEIRESCRSEMARIRSRVDEADRLWRDANTRVIVLVPTAVVISLGLIGWAALSTVTEGRRRLAAERATAALESARDDSDRDARELAERIRVFNALSHDIRTPIQVIGLTADYLWATGVTSQWVDQIRRQVADIGGILDRILATTRAVESPLPPDDPYDLSVLAAPECEVARRAAQAKGLAFAEEIPRMATSANHRAVRQILRSLLDNAVKFTESGGVTVVGSASGGEALLEVRDTGPGIHPDALDGLFRDLAPGKNPARDPGRGLGLGLANARRLAKRLGGDVRAESREGAGSSFTLALPAPAIDRDARAPAGPEGTPPCSPPRSSTADARDTSTA